MNFYDPIIKFAPCNRGEFCDTFRVAIIKFCHGNTERNLSPMICVNKVNFMSAVSI